jgi:hypothetical protein
MTDDRQLVSLRVDRPLYARIKAAAGEENRSMNNYLSTVLNTVVPSDNPDDLWVQESIYSEGGFSETDNQVAS